MKLAKRVCSPILLICLVCGTAVFLAGCAAQSKETAQDKKGGRGGGGPVPVLVAKVGQKNVPVEIQVIGNVEAYNTITVKAQVSGELVKVNFHEGDMVKKDDLLFNIDPRQLQAALHQSEATLARNRSQQRLMEANLAKDLAQEQLVKSQLERSGKLMAEGVISREQNDQASAAAQVIAESVSADRAAIESAKADIEATQANIENLKVQMGYTTIRSPIDGKTGNLNIKQGNIVSANTTDLITINQIQPVYVTFSVPEAQLMGIKQYMGNGKLAVRAATQDGTPIEETGFLSFMDNNVDTSTGTIKLKATFPNADRKLWPGLFLRVTLRLTTNENAVVVPNQAVQSGQDGSYVYVVKQDNTVESRQITTGARVEQDMVIEKGLQAGETVVTEGQLRLAPGMRVQVREGSGRPGGRKKT